MTDPLLSIIAPVYNVEKYLSACIDSVLRQTFKDYELILVDDGSTDGSGAICDKYANEYDSIIAIHERNSGVSKARNHALDIARGRYITFIDSDDKYDDISTLERNIVILTSDPSIDYLQFPYINDDGEEAIRCSLGERVLSSKAEILSLMLTESIPGYLWIKIFRADLFENLRFREDIRLTEDLRILIDMFEHVNKVYLSDSGAYRYCRHNDSLTLAVNPKKESQCIASFTSLLALSKKYPDVSPEAVARRYFDTLSVIERLGILTGYNDYIFGKIAEIKVYKPNVKLRFSKQLESKYRFKLSVIALFGYDFFIRNDIRHKKAANTRI